MGFLKTAALNPFALLLCLLGGAVAGAVAPSVATPAFVVGQIYLALINMVAIPLLVVATFFGLRQTLSLPKPVHRTIMMVVVALALVLISATIGAVVGQVAGPGRDLSVASRAYLGTVVLNSDGAAGNAEILLFGTDTGAPQLDETPWAAALPDNFFRALVNGETLGVLICAILFGLAFASMGKTRSNTLMGIFEAIYRTFETIISRVNLLIPILVFGLAAHFVANVDGQILRAMGSFIAVFTALSSLLAAVAVLVVWRSSTVSLLTVISSLKTPMLISLTSASAPAAVPDTIRAMSAKLGYSRGIVELVVPAAAIFVRAGSAVYFSLLAVFVANIYGHTLSGMELGLICIGATLSAFASAGSNSFAIVGSGAIVLSMLNLPVEAALALFLAIDLICEAPRNLLSTLCCCVLIVLVCRGLPSERAEPSPEDGVSNTAPIKFSFSRGNAMAALACCAVLAGLVVVAGISIGQKADRSSVLRNTAALSGGLLIDNPARSK